MQADDIKALSDVRLGHALECLDTAQKVMGLGDYKCAANRSYYAVFHAIRSVLALDIIHCRIFTLLLISKNTKYWQLVLNKEMI